MLRVGLTGSIGSGKTVVAKIFEALGVDVFYADAVGKSLLHLEEVKRDIVRCFGEQVLDENRHIVRKRLADIVFHDASALQALNAIIHPGVKQQLMMWFAKRQASPYAIQEAAILFESGFDQYCDAVISVSAPAGLRIQRVMIRDHITREDVLARMKNQWNDEEKANKADFVIINDRERLVIPQVLQIHEQLLLRSKSK
ncbi:MAG: dephospho-CoA kinase [Bacteroidales bacterium]|nr:dephospho-CoA kinase [Lentimicrobiaceae bacterium]MDD5693996.1 dephospho-CoA kinase [Bacteroidales bacterium]